MSQHDFDILNQLFPATRTDLNAAFVALASNSSGDAEPAIKYANQWWYETDTNTLKIRNEANSNWISICTLDQSNNNVLSITTQGLTLGATALTSTGVELNQLASLTRGSLIYGNASGATARLAKGAAATVLTSDGTDISWASGTGGVPTGMILPHTTATDPTGFIECDGAAVSRSTYSALFGIISDDYGAGDGSSTFNVPDLRGTFIRGFANGSANDADRAARTNRGDGTTGDVVGSKQADAIRNIVGEQAAAYAALHQSGLSLTGAFYKAGTASTNYSEQSGLGARLGFDASRTVATGSDNRPLNVQMMYCIKT